MRMKKAGCERVEFGVESGNQQILNNIDKDIKLTQVEKAVNLAKKVGLSIGCSFILGNPLRDGKNDSKTLLISQQN